jgi:hypothetical protein
VEDVQKLDEIECREELDYTWREAQPVSHWDARDDLRIIDLQKNGKGKSYKHEAQLECVL